MEKPAILGGTPTLNSPLPETNNIGEEEKNAVAQVMESGVLSDFLGRAGDKFLGGSRVLAFESATCEKFDVSHAVSFNSATTALEAAVCALGIGPGDEVIVSPYSISASATCILSSGAIPIFADIEKDTFCLDPADIERKITDKTKAIIVVNIFGGSARYDQILALAKKHNLRIIEDNAQAAGGMYGEKHLGTLGDIGVLSFNYHKTIHCGEGGVLITNDEHLAYRAQLRRNHAEAVLDDLNKTDEAIFGSNHRLSEIHAAIAIEQLKKLDFLNEKRIELAEHLTSQLSEIAEITPCTALPNTKHVYYVYPFLFSSPVLSRSQFAGAMQQEGFALNEGYIKPIHLLNLFQSQKPYPHSSFPFDYNRELVSYPSLPTVESYWKDQFMLCSLCRYPLTKEHIDQFVSAIKKILFFAEDIAKQ